MENVELNDDMLREIAGGSSEQGMPCPRCNGFIPVTMNELLSAQYITCPNCQLRLDINLQKTNKAMNALKSVKTN